MYKRQENREKILAQAPQVKDIFSKINQRSAVLNQPLEPFVEKIINYLDENNGSFKGAPKFPQFYLFDAMFYFYLKTKNKNYFKPVEILLNNLCTKGIYDQLEGGISRYAVDEKWIIPHFEKMLYDNIQFIDLLTKFYQNTKNDYFKNKLLQTIQYFNNEFKIIFNSKWSQKRFFINIGNESLLLTNPISGIYTPFSIILYYEIFLLIYYLPRSFTTSILKQFEIISLIVIRRIFYDIPNTVS